MELARLQDEVSFNGGSESRDMGGEPPRPLIDSGAGRHYSGYASL